MALSAWHFGDIVYLRARLKLSAAEGIREAVLAGQGFGFRCEK
jgi:hypothetical protein